jgi:hypothetical protein
VAAAGGVGEVPADCVIVSYTPQASPPRASNVLALRNDDLPSVRKWVTRGFSSACRQGALNDRSKQLFDVERVHISLDGKA